MNTNDFNNWAEVYDIIYNNKKENDREFKFYEKLIKKNEDPILEMACGTGRLYVDFLEKGYNIYGSDISESMLNVTREKCEERGLTPNLYQGDSKDISIDNEFGLIYYPFSSLQHLRGIENQKKTFKNIYNHIKKGGQFAFDLPKPSIEYINENYGNLIQETVVKDDVEYLIEYWSEITNEAKLECDLSERVINKDTNEIVYESTFELTLLPKEQVEILLEYTGFSDYKIYNEFTNEEFTDEHDRMTFVATK